MKVLLIVMRDKFGDVFKNLHRKVVAVFWIIVSVFIDYGKEADMRVVKFERVKTKRVKRERKGEKGGRVKWEEIEGNDSMIWYVK